MPSKGDIVAGRYRLIAPLASGGMGTVWRALHMTLQVEVAIKLTSEAAGGEQGRKRFRLEAQAAARLRSPHIVQVLDFGNFDDQLYLAMELLTGEDLAHRIAREGALPLEQCASIV